MCGIAGYVDFSSAGAAEAVLRAMAHALRRRGPDGNGVLVEGPSGMAHARLSIIDVAGSPQPMRVRGSATSLVYNGELYNYRELRDALVSQGVSMDTAGDTEVLLRWVDREGPEALPRFDGMFGFAAWDSRGESLLLARDPLGVKPLFYATPAPGLLVYGSEIKAMLEHPAVGRELDEDALRQVMRFRAVYGERTLYASVRQLEPGTYLQFDRSGMRVGRYFDLIAKTAEAQQRVRRMGVDELVAEGWETFKAAVRKRLVADVPVGAFLSGGLDSSLVTAAMRELREPGEEVCTFSVGFEDDERSELGFAATVARALGTRHQAVQVGVGCYGERLSELTGCRDAPLSEPADVAMAEMSRAARSTVKVVLSGEGADEVFGGYPKYRMAGVPGVVGSAIRAVGAARASRWAGAMGVDGRRALVAARALSQGTEAGRLVQWFSYLDRADLEGLLPGMKWTEGNWAETAARQSAALGQLGGLSALGRMQGVDCLTWLPGNLLERADRMTMAEGLEARVPFLDKALVPFGLAAPDRVKVRGRTLKWIVRQWAARRLPAEIVGRKKWGFRVPLAAWFRGGMRGMLHDYLTSRDGLCATYGDTARVRAMLDAHMSGSVDANLALWTLFSAEVWYQDVFRGRGREAAAGS